MAKEPYQRSPSELMLATVAFAARTRSPGASSISSPAVRRAYSCTVNGIVARSSATVAVVPRPATNGHHTAQENH